MFYLPGENEIAVEYLRVKFEVLFSYVTAANDNQTATYCRNYNTHNSSFEN